MSNEQIMNEKKLKTHKGELFVAAKLIDSNMLDAFTFFYNEVCDLIFYNFLFLKEGSPFSSFIGNDRDSVFNFIEKNSLNDQSREQFETAKDIQEDTKAVSRTIILLDSLFKTFLNDLVSADKSLTTQQKFYIKKKGFKVTKHHIVNSNFYKEIERTKLWKLMFDLRETSNFFKHNNDLVNLERDDINSIERVNKIEIPSSKELVSSLSSSMIDFFSYISSDENFYNKGVGNPSNRKDKITLHKEALRTYIDYIYSKFNL